MTTATSPKPLIRTATSSSNKSSGHVHQAETTENPSGNLLGGFLHAKNQSKAALRPSSIQN
jgi:hypothetical protein